MRLLLGAARRCSSSPARRRDRPRTEDRRGEAISLVSLQVDLGVERLGRHRRRVSASIERRPIAVGSITASALAVGRPRAGIGTAPFANGSSRARRARRALATAPDDSRPRDRDPGLGWTLSRGVCGDRARSSRSCRSMVEDARRSPRTYSPTARVSSSRESSALNSRRTRSAQRACRTAVASPSAVLALGIGRRSGATIRWSFVESASRSSSPSAWLHAGDHP